MKFPDFLIIGAMKAGTTSLYQYLKQHPDIYMSPVKEPNYFTFGESERCLEIKKAEPESRVCGIEEYAALFENASDEKAVGEATTSYLDCHFAAERIKTLIPDVKLIAILRDPADRAHSHFMYNKRLFYEKLSSLELCIEQEESRVEEDFSTRYKYLGKGFYYQHLQRYREFFPEHQIKVLLFEEFKHNPGSVLQDIFLFLGVDETFAPDISIKYNTSGSWRNGAVKHIMQVGQPLVRVLQKRLPPRLVSQIGRTIMKPAASKPDTRQFLISHYRQDVLQLQELLNKDLSSWLH